MRSLPFRTAIILVFAACAVGIVFAHLDGSPVGHTGAPGEGTCADAGCHDLPSDHIGRIQVANYSEQGDTLGFTLRLTDDRFTADWVEHWGFQLTISDSLDQPYGKLIVQDSLRTQVDTGLSGRQYLTHTAAGSPDHCCGYSNWTFKWVRPAGGDPTNLIRFNVSGVLADGDLSRAGDAVVTDTLDSHFCLIRMAGDCNLNGGLSSADLIYLINYLFKGGATPLPCAANGDVNCSGAVTSGDLIHLLNYVFKSGTAPCDICALVLDGTWSCD